MAKKKAVGDEDGRPSEMADSVVGDDGDRPVHFSKNKILNMKRFANRRDLLSVILHDDVFYTFEAVDAAISEFMERRVS